MLAAESVVKHSPWIILNGWNPRSTYWERTHARCATNYPCSTYQERTHARCAMNYPRSTYQERTHARCAMNHHARPTKKEPTHIRGTDSVRMMSFRWLQSHWMNNFLFVDECLHTIFQSFITLAFVGNDHEMTTHFHGTKRLRFSILLTTLEMAAQTCTKSPQSFCNEQWELLFFGILILVQRPWCPVLKRVKHRRSLRTVAHAKLNYFGTDQNEIISWSVW